MSAFELSSKSSGITKIYRATSYAEAHNDALQCQVFEGFRDDITCKVNGKEVSFDEFVSICAAKEQKSRDKKNETHKLISYKTSYCENSRVYKWVKR